MDGSYQIPFCAVNDANEKHWLPCSGNALCKVVIGNLDNSLFLDKNSIIKFLVANPGLLITALFDLSPTVSKKIKRSDIVDWFRSKCLNTVGEARPQESAIGDTSVEKKAFAKFHQRISTVAESDKFNKSLRKLLSRLVPDYSTPKLPRLELSGKLLDSLSKSARRIIENQYEQPECDFPQIIAELRESNTVRDEFETELLRRKMDSMRLLAYGASHEINNPLANIATRAQALLPDETDAKRKHRLAVIYEQAMRAHEMISDMMLFAHPPALNKSPINLVDVVEGVMAELKSNLDATSIKCVIVDKRGENETPILHADLTQISSAIKALLKNSIEAIGEIGKIEIEIGTVGKLTNLIVSDDGPGVDPELDENIFDPFFSGREAGRGLGFGLSKVWRIVQMHGASISRVAGRLGGESFMISFPESQVDLEQTCLIHDRAQAA